MSLKCNICIDQWFILENVSIEKKKLFIQEIHYLLNIIVTLQKIVNV